MPVRQPKRKRLWLSDGSFIRLRSEHKNHVWSYDFVKSHTADGRGLRILIIIDEFTRECLSLYIARNITSREVIEQLYELFILRGVPEYIHSDNGSEFTAKAIRQWLADIGVKTLYIEPGSPWENGTTNHSTVNCRMGYSKGRYLPIIRKPGYWLKGGAGSIIMSGLTVPRDTGHRRQRLKY